MKMKKALGVVLSLGLLVSLAGCGAQQAPAPTPTPTPVATPAPVAETKAEPLKMGKVDTGATGTKSFVTATVAMQGDKIVGVVVDEYQFMDAKTSKGVPNSDKDFGKEYKDATVKVLSSKLTNTETYSKNMQEKAGSTQSWDKNMSAVEEFAVGKTVAELEKILKDTPVENLPVDTITGSTLANTGGYLETIVEAAKVAK